MMENEEQEIFREDLPQLIHRHEVTSTNIALREMIAADILPEGSVLWADFQNAGRGQAGNQWESEVEKNLLFSIVLKPTILQAREQFLISQIAALSVKKTLDDYVNDISIKWPNDIYWKDKKISGMLIENDLTGSFIYSSIIGIGINLNQELFCSDAPNPISLKQITGKNFDREEVLRQFVSHFYANYLLLLQEKREEIREAYRSMLYRKEGLHRYQDANGSFDAVIHGVEPTGHLLLQLRDKTIRRFAFKEVSYLPDK